MLRTASLMILLLCFSVSAYGQTRVLAGISGGDSFDNEQFGGTVSLEIPYAHRYELDLRDTFSPLESHVGLGRGKANNVGASGIVWLTSAFGVTGTEEYSNYDVTKVAKGGVYVYGGPIWRKVLWGAPVRLEADYIRQTHNGIASGIETSHLQGLAFSFDVRMGCTWITCFRMKEQFAVGQVLTQGNPVCDGTNGPVPAVFSCPRSKAVGGSFTGALRMEFPRRRNTENDIF